MLRDKLVKIPRKEDTRLTDRFFYEIRRAFVS
jgi:hypothetical protein